MARVAILRDGRAGCLPHGELIRAGLLGGSSQCRCLEVSVPEEQRLFAWLTLALLMALFVSVPLGMAVEMPIDTGFETGVDGARLSSVWSASGSAPFQNYDYDDGDVFRPKVGSKYGYFKGPATTAYADITAASPISTDDSAITFWYHIDAHENYRYMLGSFWSGATIGTYWLRMDSTGNIGAYTSKTGVTGYPRDTYVPIGTMPTGWTQVQDDTELHHRHLHVLHASRHRVALDAHEGRGRA